MARHILIKQTEQDNYVINYRQKNNIPSQYPCLLGNPLRMPFKIQNFTFWYILPSIKKYIAKTPIHASIRKQHPNPYNDYQIHIFVTPSYHWRKFKWTLRKERTQNLFRHPIHIFITPYYHWRKFKDPLRKENLYRHPLFILLSNNYVDTYSTYIVESCSGL